MRGQQAVEALVAADARAERGADERGRGADSKVWQEASLSGCVCCWDNNRRRVNGWVWRDGSAALNEEEEDKLISRPALYKGCRMSLNCTPGPTVRTWVVGSTERWFRALRIICRPF
jgi:hypothetical protein